MAKITGIERAIAQAGGLTALARAFDPPVTHNAVIAWRDKGYAPHRRALEIQGMFPDIALVDLVSPDLRPLVTAR